MEEQVDYKISSNTFDKIIQSLERDGMSQRDRGTLFEVLVTAYLQYEPMYSRLFDSVWMLHDVPEEYGIPKKDTGVDLVARNRDTGELIAIQCKYYSKETTIQKSHIDSFLNEVGKNYYSEGIIISSTDKWSNNANDALLNRDKNISRIGLSQLRESEIDWSIFSLEKPKEIQLKSTKKPRFHQIPAIEAVVNGFKVTDRGKLIMAPGTGKTYTSMVIAERMAEEKDGTFKVLYLVPSIQLLSQSLRGWTADSKYREDMDTFAVCSDRKVTKKQSESELEDITTADLGYPATTDYRKLLDRQKDIDSSDSQSKFLVVFSTYQSIDVIIEAQNNGFYEFDLVICDEAHRTTGATESGKESSSFVKVHSNNNIKATKRLYQTATPRVYGEDAKKKADEMSVVIADMNDSDIYGEEFYRIGFGDAVNRGILTDYKVMVLAVDEETIARSFQTMLSNKRDSELEFDDITKIIGCWNGLVKRKSNSNVISSNPMKRAIAFAGTIRESKKIENMFTQIVDHYVSESGNATDTVQVEIQHADGSMNALQKNEKISWLKSDVPPNTCRILTNARFLTEGVDVPDLDAVMFLKPRKSRIDIAQAIGRVMRKANGKDYGYVILPIGIPAGIDPENVLDNNDRYKVIWDVLNALRSLDERFDATINKLELNKKKPDQLQVIGVGSAPDESEGGFTITEPESEQLSFNYDDDELSDLERVIYGKIVHKVGNVRYWEDWSKDVANIAQQHIMRIRIMLEDTSSEAYKEFKKFMISLHHNINNSISYDQAIEMLAQHLITKPVFEALFDSYSFVHNNPVSKSMNSILSVLDEQGLLKEQEKLNDFYNSVRVRAEGIDNLKAKQDIIVQLYDKFFRVAFKETTERLGIVFTPVEVVDFIIKAVNDVLNKHFGKSLSSEGVHVLDPFTGTGTFITRILQSGLIPKEDLLRKYTQELHANEIILLSYYIAAINIEETFHNLTNNNYLPFEGIVLTDTFESAERENSFIDELFNENNERLKKQQNKPIFAIVGNPPYSARQTNDNDNNQNTRYPLIDDQIKNTYVKYSSASNKNTLYDSLVRAFRWSTDRIGEQGVISFVTNNSYIDSQTASGIRKCFYEDFNYLYIINLRGSVRGRSGDDAKREGQNVFNILTGVSICLLIKDGSDKHELKYYDIGDYLTRDEKLEKLNSFKSIDDIDWSIIIPDKSNDWINQRDEKYLEFISIDPEENGIFKMKSLGVSTNRDAWVYGFSKDNVNDNTVRMITNVNSEMDRLKNIVGKQEKISQLNSDTTFVSWSAGLKQVFSRNEKLELNPNELNIHTYRPFTKKWLYYNKNIIERPRKYKKAFGDNNKAILVPGSGSRRSFSCLMVNAIPDLNILDAGAQGFLLYNNEIVSSLLENDNSNIYSNVSEQFGLSTDDIFYYIYAVLHSDDYRQKYASNLKKQLPRIPNLRNKKTFVEIGRKLADLHLNYESIPPYDGVKIECKSNPSYKVTKMKHPKKGIIDKIIFNSDITITNIPKKAYEYVINGRSAIEWVMDQYQIKTDKKSNITDDPNKYSDDEKYILNLLLSIINVSIQTVDLISSLPSIEIE